MSLTLERLNPPARLVRVTQGTPTIDKEKRTIRNTVTTRLLARDGGIVKPEGIITRFFEQNPVVQALHGRGDTRNSPVIGKSLGLEVTPRGMESVTQFADTELGREYAYLYGINDKGEVFMRAWSFGWNSLEVERWSLDQAKSYLGNDWDESVLSVFDKRMNDVWVSVRSEMLEYSAVAVGADREGLSRAFAGNVRMAGELITALDLEAARSEICALKNNTNELTARCDLFEQKIQALSREGSEAARRGDSSALLEEIKSLVRLVKGE